MHWIFLFIHPQVGLKENPFTVFPPLNPKEEIPNALASLPIILVFTVVQLLAVV